MQINASMTSMEYSPKVGQKTEVAGEQEPVQTKPETVSTESKIEKTENIDKLKSILAENDITLKFSQDAETKQLVVELVDNKTGEAIRQMPSEISLKLTASFVKMQGQFVDTKE